MKIATVVTILSAALLVLLSFTATALLSDMSEPTADMRFEDLQSGWLLPMLCGPTLWSNLPSFPNEVTTVLNLYALAYVAICLACVSIPNWRWQITSRTGTAIVLLLLGMLPNMLGAMVLRDGLASPVTVGLWLSFMIMSLLYAAGAALVIAICDLPTPVYIRTVVGSRTATPLLVSGQ